MPPPPPNAELRPVNPRVWRACAGSPVQIPSLNSRVYYFPQGHLEQSFSPTSPPLLSNLALSKPWILCRISAVQFLADSVTDEVYAELLLVPLDLSSSNSTALGFLGSSLRPLLSHEGVATDDDKVVANAKVLTPSDANNGGGFSVPRSCADSIFPPLNYDAESPVQTLKVTDIHGITWQFRHIYRGMPRRHLLTTGWSKFVNRKMLVAGDSVVFMRNSRGETLVGVRRAERFNTGGECAMWREQIGDTTGDKEEEGGFSRSGRGRVSPAAVTEAVERAAQGLQFRVVYYPRAGFYSDFVVKAKVVEAALNRFWTSGMRVKIATEAEDSSRMTWFQGTVAAASVPDCGPWQGSPWRMLQITWDQHEVLQNVKRVSPWQVEFVGSTPLMHSAFPPSKKFRFPENVGMLTDGEREHFFPLSDSDLTNSTMGHMNASLLNYNTFPAGMQGARQDTFSIFGVSNLLSEIAPHMLNDNAFGNNMTPKLTTLSTELNIGSSESENLSEDGQSREYSSGMVVGNQGCSPASAGIGSFQLFGKVIQMNQHVGSGFDDVGHMEDDEHKGYETDGINNGKDLS